MQALDFKLKYGLISNQELMQERRLLKALLRESSRPTNHSRQLRAPLPAPIQAPCARSLNASKAAVNTACVLPGTSCCRITWLAAGLINFGEGISTTAVALMLVRKMASSDVGLMRALLECGAAQELQRLQVRCQQGMSRRPARMCSAVTPLPVLAWRCSDRALLLDRGCRPTAQQSSPHPWRQRWQP